MVLIMVMDLKTVIFIATNLLIKNIMAIISLSNIPLIQAPLSIPEWTFQNGSLPDGSLKNLTLYSDVVFSACTLIQYMP